MMGFEGERGIGPDSLVNRDVDMDVEGFTMVDHFQGRGIRLGKEMEVRLFEKYLKKKQEEGWMLFLLQEANFQKIRPNWRRGESEEKGTFGIIGVRGHPSSCLWS
jgi:hypothetical protein